MCLIYLSIKERKSINNFELRDWREYIRISFSKLNSIYNL